MSNLKKATQALRTGHLPGQSQSTRTVPIYQSTAYEFNNTDHAANLFGLKEFGYIYTRLNNPTNDILEQRLAALEDGIGAVSFASGTSAFATTILTLCKAGDHIISSSSLYGGSYNLLNATLPRLGITTTFVDPADPEAFQAAIQPNTKLIFAESLGNPKLDIIDLEALGKVAKANKIPFIVDNTLPTPFLLQPKKFGADIIIHSLTKYISGNGSSLGGIVIDSGTFDWGNGTFEEFITARPEFYHGLELFPALGNLSFLVKLRIEGLRDYGAAISPLNAFQILQGLDSLSVRIKQQSENALALAKWLEEQEEVAWVNYPGLESSNYSHLQEKYLPNGQSGLVTFGLHTGFDGAKQFTDCCEIFSLVANFGESKSLIIHPASTTHQQLTVEQQASTGVTPDLIRLSVGLEDLEDLKNDITQSLTKIESYATADIH